jgi:hypothetical protein
MLPPFAVPALNRRQFLQTSAGLVAMLGEQNASCSADEVKTVAAVVTEFRTNSHAEVIVSRWLEGFELDGKSAGPKSKLVALYTDQVAAKDISRALADKHKVPIYPTIRETLCRGGNKLAVDGVVLVGEHGNYPFNDKEQHLYPRRRFFEETIQVFRDSGRVVPVFSDKHLSFSWENAKWMYDQAVSLKVPFMAGSSMPTAWRKPALDLDVGSKIEEAVAIAYGGLESYGFHALESLQCLMERRQGGETGVAAVTCVEGDAVWKAAEDRRWSRALLDTALAVAPNTAKKGKPEDKCKKPSAFLIEYKDGRRGTVLMLNGYNVDWVVALRLTGKAEPVATSFWLQDGRPFGHFTMLVQGIDAMIQSGKPSWPVERTLLTTGILDAAMTSKFEKNKRLETPHLAIAYPPGPAWKLPAAPLTGPQPPTG